MNFDLNWLKADGAATPLRRLRNELAADLVYMWVPNPVNGVCGVANVPHLVNGQVQSASDSDGLYSAVGAVNGGCQFGDVNVFAHEVGHLLGAEHNPEDVPNDPEPTYARGYRVDGFRRTIMSYNCATAFPVDLRFSNPSKNFTNSTTASGTETAKNGTRHRVDRAGPSAPGTMTGCACSLSKMK